MERWLRENEPLARVIRLPEREGLIAARQAGIKEATGDVVVVLDSHCEVITGWLPPLLGEFGFYMPNSSFFMPVLWSLEWLSTSGVGKEWEKIK